MSSFELLINEHELLGAQAATIGALLDPDCPRVAEALAERARLAEMLGSHLAREDAEIYPRLIACRDPATARTAQNFQVEFGRLIEAWTEYLARWDEAAMTADWLGFCHATRAIFTQLATRIAHENALLYPAALGASVIALRAA